MILINTKTGGVISSSSVAMGEFWVEKGKEITEEKNEEVTETKSDQTKNQTENQDDKSTITKKDIMQELDALKIEYDSKMTKDELLKLLQG
jgi:flagellar basal body P-ring protein FlgI